jgi:hypothetical protein
VTERFATVYVDLYPGQRWGRHGVKLGLNVSLIWAAVMVSSGV